MKCVKCGKELPEGINFCTECGAPLNNIRCPKCNFKLKGSESFCPNCGYNLNGIEKSAMESISDGVGEIVSGFSKSLKDFRNRNNPNYIPSNRSSNRQVHHQADDNNNSESVSIKVEYAIDNSNYNENILKYNGFDMLQIENFKIFMNLKNLKFRENIIDDALIDTFLKENPAENIERNSDVKKYVSIPIDFNNQLIGYNGLDGNSDKNKLVVFLENKNLSINSDLIPQEIIDEFFNSNPSLTRKREKNKDKYFFLYGYNENILKNQHIEENTSFINFMWSKGMNFYYKPVTQSLIDEFILNNPKIKEKIKERKMEAERLKIEEEERKRKEEEKRKLEEAKRRKEEERIARERLEAEAKKREEAERIKHERLEAEKARKAEEERLNLERMKLEAKKRDQIKTVEYDSITKFKLCSNCGTKVIKELNICPNCYSSFRDFKNIPNEEVKIDERHSIKIKVSSIEKWEGQIGFLGNIDFIEGAENQLIDLGSINPPNLSVLIQSKSLTVTDLKVQIFRDDNLIKEDECRELGGIVQLSIKFY